MVAAVQHPVGAFRDDDIVHAGALALFREMRGQSLLADEYTFPAATPLHDAPAGIARGRSVHAATVRRELHPFCIQTTLIVEYAQNDRGSSRSRSTSIWSDPSTSQTT